MKILVVEDDELVREMAVEALKDEGFDVIEAATGEDAIAHCRGGGADVLFTDIRLPGPVTGGGTSPRNAAGSTRRFR